ncbi:MAG: hypothetical protein EOP09_05560 [Proteobacteria bacterium]|nr:MAG: hypothetical protein EOP09_05560 [Pseudomonadota bacterium]
MACPAAMNHPETILRTLDRHLTRPVRLILYGRAALALGFPDSPSEFSATMDVDAILPRVELSAIEKNDDFWSALERSNTELEPSGLYITHLFVDDQLILTPDWTQRLKAVQLEDLKFLQLFRPDAGDLILTKMMRVDPQDRSDIAFLLDRFSGNITKDYIERASLPELDEIREAFSVNREWLAQRLIAD